MHRVLRTSKVAPCSAVRPPVCVRQLLGPDVTVPLLPRAGHELDTSSYGLREGWSCCLLPYIVQKASAVADETPGPGGRRLILPPCDGLPYGP